MLAAEDRGPGHKTVGDGLHFVGADVHPSLSFTS
jgi:hypothetical protein